MSQFSSANVGFVLSDGYNLLGITTTLQDNVEAIIQESTAFGDTWAAFVSAGVKKGALSQSGFYDDAAGSINAAMAGNEGASRVFMYNLEGNTIGAHFVGYAGVLEAKYERVLTLEKLHVANVAYNPSGEVELGQVLKTFASISADGDTKATSVDHAVKGRVSPIPITSNTVANPTLVTTTVAHGLIDNDVAVVAGVASSDPTINGARVVTVTGAGGVTKLTVPVNVTTPGTGGTITKAWSKNGGGAFVQCTALSLGGWTDLTVKVQHSADDSTYADLVTFTAITVAPAKERKTVAAGTTVNRYLAASWAFTGAGAAHTATFVVGFARA